ncbi:hypothetical protein ABIC84_003262 [Mucilaginibacter sp. 3215]
MFVNWLLMLPAYQNLVHLLKLPAKPFLCEYCLNFWLNLILAVALQNASYLIIAVTAPVVTVIIKRIIDALPVSL